MKEANTYQALTSEQIEKLEAQGCSAQDWAQVLVADGFEPARLRNAHFLGQVQIGNFAGDVKDPGGIEKPCGIYNATIVNCTIGDNSRIANIGVHIANYDIDENVCIENVATIQTDANAVFGNGIEVDVLNEAGGREVVLFDELSVQFAYLMCLHRYRPKMIKKLRVIADKYVQSVRSDRGKVGFGAHICSTKEIIDVNIGPFAMVNGASSLKNGTVLSSVEAPTVIGANVVAKDFIVAESSSVTDGAILAKTFVGQGCQVGKQFTSENSLFFANCEAFLGEACSIFAGPYTVTHHKSTLLIAGLFSFFNAGSGTNQSNHMYKLGPVHEGKLERGTKTGSFSYIMWPCRTGPFSVVLGKHTSTFDTTDFPFSHLDARSDGKCAMVPGLHLTTVGTVRDGAKWPSRDRRKGTVKRDKISFDVFSPYTVGKMIRASATLKELQENTDRSIGEVNLQGAIVKRLILRTSQKYYRTGIEMYLLEKIVEKAENVETKLSECFAVDPGAVYSDEWVDIGGLLMAKARLVELEDSIEDGSISTMDEFAVRLRKIEDSSKKDEWAWVKEAYKQIANIDMTNASREDVIAAAEMFLKTKTRFLKLVIADAEKEFSQLSHCGFGVDGTDDAEKDFAEVRGVYDENKFIIEMKNNVEQLQQRIDRFKQKLLKLE